MFVFEVFSEIPFLQIIVALLYVALFVGFIVFVIYASKSLFIALSLKKALVSKKEKYSFYSGGQIPNRKPLRLADKEQEDIKKKINNKISIPRREVVIGMIFSVLLLFALPLFIESGLYSDTILAIFSIGTGVYAICAALIFFAFACSLRYCFIGAYEHFYIEVEKQHLYVLVPPLVKIILTGLTVLFVVIVFTAIYGAVYSTESIEATDKKEQATRMLEASIVYEKENGEFTDSLKDLVEIDPEIKYNDANKVSVTRTSEGEFFTLTSFLEKGEDVIKDRGFAIQGNSNSIISTCNIKFDIDCKNNLWTVVPINDNKLFPISNNGSTSIGLDKQKTPESKNADKCEGNPYGLETPFVCK